MIGVYDEVFFVGSVLAWVWDILSLTLECTCTGLEIHHSKAFGVVPTSIALVPCLFPCAPQLFFLQYFQFKKCRS
jgi:hypothetical protein